MRVKFCFLFIDVGDDTFLHNQLILHIHVGPFTCFVYPFVRIGTLWFCCVVERLLRPVADDPLDRLGERERERWGVRAVNRNYL